MTILVFIILWTALILICLNILLPVLFTFGAYCFKSKPSAAKGNVDKISIILPLFNEERVIAQKMDNVRAALTRVTKPYEVLLGSDGSTDQTEQVVRDYIQQYQLDHWHVLAFTNQGKGATISQLVEKASGDLIISTDADVTMDESAICLAQGLFEDEADLGCLSSVPVFALKKNSVQSMYWRLEKTIRHAESCMGKLIVVTGWLYAFRRNLYQAIPRTVMADDLWIPLNILLLKKNVRHHADFKAYSEKTDEETEIQRRKRVVSGGMDVVLKLLPELRKRPFLCLIVFLHKVNRWLLPVWCCLFAGACFYLDPRWFAGFILLLLLGCVVLKPRRMLYIIQSAWAPIGAIGHMRRHQDLSKWDKTRIS